MRNWIGLTTAILVVVTTALLAQDRPTSPPAAKPPAGNQNRNLGAALIAGLQATPGCLGTESATTSSGKNVIFAWFKDKQAVLAWYESKTHTKAMRSFFPDPTPNYEPIAGVPDDAGPLLVIASMKLPKLGAKPDANGAPPIPEFSIDTLTPVTPGLTTTPTGSFAPPDFRKLFEERQAKLANK